MLNELGEDRYDSLREKTLKTFPLMAAVLEKNQSGAVFASGEADPRTVFIISRSGFSFLYTADPELDYGAFCRFLVETPAIPQYLHIYDAPSGLSDYVRVRPEEFGIKLRTRIQLQYRKEEISPEAFRPAMEADAFEIGDDNMASIGPLGLDIESKFWDSKAHFIEIDILTAPDHQKKGLAKYATALFIRQGLQKGIRTNWDCFEDNAGSLHTALALKFTAVKNYPLLSLFLKEKEK